MVIHGVLERIQDEEELAELLEVAIGALESPELEERMGPGTAYRLALEEEVRVLVASPEWRWYVEVSIGGSFGSCISDGLGSGGSGLSISIVEPSLGT